MQRLPRNNKRLCLEELESRIALSTLATSTNWSGYAVNTAAGAVTAVSGSWVVPTSSGTGTAYSSSWVGIDGFSSSSVEQLGTDSDVYNGTPAYYAWYEIYPSASVEIAMTVKPGDTIKASVTYTSGSFVLQLTDTPKSGGLVESFSITKSYAAAQRSSAEWIEEAPSSNSGVLTLANFGTMSFTQATATISGVTGAIDNSKWSSEVYQINMSSSKNHDTTTGLIDTNGTSSFSVTFVPTITSPPPPPPPPPPPHHRFTEFLPATAQDTVTADISAATAIALNSGGASTSAPATPAATTTTQFAPPVTTAAGVSATQGSSAQALITLSSGSQSDADLYEMPEPTGPNVPEMPGGMNNNGASSGHGVSGSGYAAIALPPIVVSQSPTRMLDGSFERSSAADAVFQRWHDTVAGSLSADDPAAAHTGDESLTAAAGALMFGWTLAGANDRKKKTYRW